MSEPARQVRTVHVELPDEFVDGANDELATRLRLLWLLDEVRHVRMSAGRAAQVAGVPLAEWHRLMAEHGIATIRMTDAELADELAAVDRIREWRTG